MTCIKFSIVEDNTGWFVLGPNRFGPFFCKQRAVDLAEGMVSAIRELGEDAEMSIAAHPDPAPLTPGQSDLADRWRALAPRNPAEEEKGDALC